MIKIKKRDLLKGHQVEGEGKKKSEVYLLYILNPIFVISLQYFPAQNTAHHNTDEPTFSVQKWSICG